MKRTLRLFAALLALVLLLAGCNQAQPEQEEPTAEPTAVPTPYLPPVLASESPIAPTARPTPTPSPTPENTPTPTPAPTIPVQPPRLSAWAAYWDTDTLLDELDVIKLDLAAVSVFSSLFELDGSLYIPDETQRLYADLRDYYDETFPMYLTIVNDVHLGEKRFSQKDTGILSMLFANEQSMDAHIAQILTLALENGYMGVELDYEAIKNDSALWTRYARFIEKLYAKAQEKNILLRVILEPSAGGRAAFPEGPEYVFMAYNLHGGHSDAGPKADAPFIEKMLADAGGLKTDCAVALATGGYQWLADGSIEQLTELQALDLAKQYAATPARDEASTALHFTYTDATGGENIVWYADGATLCAWCDVAKAQGVTRFALWRLDGCTPETLTAIAKHIG